VTDTKLGRTQHEQTGRHQGAIQRFLRGIHKKNLSEQRQSSVSQSELSQKNQLPPSSSSSQPAPSTNIYGKKIKGREDTKPKVNISNYGIAGLPQQLLDSEVPVYPSQGSVEIGDWHTVGSDRQDEVKKVTVKEIKEIKEKRAIEDEKKDVHADKLEEGGGDDLGTNKKQDGEHRKHKREDTDLFSYKESEKKLALDLEEDAALVTFKKRKPKQVPTRPTQQL
jgi:hypothetical protein